LLNETPRFSLDSCLSLSDIPKFEVNLEDENLISYDFENLISLEFAQ